MRASLPWKTLVAVCAISILSPLSAGASIIFETDSFTGTSTNRDQLGLYTRIEVASDQTITNIAVDLDLDVASGNLNYVIFNSISGALLFETGAENFLDDGFSFKKSSDFLFTLLAGTRYAIGVQTDVSADYHFIVPGGTTMNGITSLGGNQNADGFLNPILNLGLAGTDGSLQLFGELFEAVPEPATLAIFGLGLAGLGLMRRRRRAA